MNDMNVIPVASALSLVGQPAQALDTPALLVDLDVLEANIARIAGECRARGISWRPHIKGNKTIEIVCMELAAGAIGVTCAKLGEAEVMAEAGVRSILIANEIVGAPKIARLVALQDRAEVMVGVDSVANCAPIAAAAEHAGKVVPVVIEVNVGMNRAGVAPGAAVVALAETVSRMPGVRLAGVMAWESQAVTIADPAEKERVVREAVAALTGSAEACRKAGHRIDVVSCGGSGTFPYCAAQPGVTEIEAGGAIFSDMHYRNDYHLDFPPALFLLASVTSRPTPARIILDAGRKAMSCDTAMPAPVGLPPAKLMKLSAEHTTIELEAPSATPEVGDKVRLVVGYGDTTVHLHEEIAAIRGGRIEAVWKVAARGRIR
jgi:D-serine deaminase-like pyridoxal phosphate-dependent protein